MDKRRAKITLVIGILLLLVLIGASTYAYFLVSASNNFSETSATSNLGALGNVTLNSGSNLRIDISADDMAKMDSDKTYYASSSGTTETPTEEVIGTASAVGEGIFQCTYKIKVEDKSTDSLYTAFQNMEGKSENQIVLNINGQDYDFNTTNLFPLTITDKFVNLTKDKVKNITASFRVINKKDINQTGLANKDINLNVKIESIDCTVTDEKVFSLPANAETLADAGGLWSSGLSGDGHRYTGTNPNNYICFGVSDKATCTGNTDAYMYRIIGVFESGGAKYMKLIKKEALNSTSTWNSNNSDVDWGSSTLYSAINGSTYLSNSTYMPSGWSDRIKSWTWNSVNTKTYESSGPNYYSITAKNVYLHEMNKTGAPSGGVHGTTTGKIGLMYASDYLLALGTTASLDYNSNTNRSDFKGSWMHLSNNDSGAPSTAEWTISRSGLSGSSYLAWRVISEGRVNYGNVTNTSSVRPVFYLNTEEVIKSGAGSLSDPFLLS